LPFYLSFHLCACLCGFWMTHKFPGHRLRFQNSCAVIHSSATRVGGTLLLWITAYSLAPLLH
jgi:hypothetical protein